MENVVYKIFSFIVIPLLMTLGFLEKKSRRVLSFVIVGITLCLIASEANNIILNGLDTTFFYYSTTISPILEEIIKALPIFFMIFMYWRRPKIEKCISVGLAVGVGFAMFENIVIFFQNGSEETIWWAISRGIGAGLMHALCTGAVAVGCYFARKDKTTSFFVVIGVIVAAIIYHGTYNCMVQSTDMTYFGILLPLSTEVLLLPIYLKYIKSKKTINN